MLVFREYDILLIERFHLSPPPPTPSTFIVYQLAQNEIANTSRLHCTSKIGSANYMYIRVARIFSGVHFFLEKVDDLFLVIALKIQAKLTTPTLQISSLSKMS